MASVAGGSDHEDARWQSYRVQGSDGAEIGCTGFGRGHPVFVASPPGLPPGFWRPLSRVTTGLRMVVVQPRGFWGSSMPAEEEHVGVDRAARDLADVVDRECAGRLYSILGYCSGGPTAFEAVGLVATPPSRLGLLSCPFREVEGGALPYDLIDRLLRNPRAKKLAESMVPIYSSRFVPVEYQEELASQFQREGVAEALLLHLRERRRYAFDLRQLRALPLVLLLGDKDDETTIAQNREVLEVRAGGCTTLRMVPSAGHFVPIENPEALHEALADIVG